MDKNKLRNLYRIKRCRMSPIVRRHCSRKLCDLFLDWPHLIESERILFYHPIDKEVDTRYLFDHNSLIDTKLIFPRVKPETRELELFTIHDHRQELIRGSYGIKEPHPEADQKISIDELDLIIVPGLVFDPQGHRIGFGGGYYDRFLSNKNNDTKTIGFAYSFQVIDSIPAAEHDHPVDYLLTENGFIKN